MNNACIDNIETNNMKIYFDTEFTDLIGVVCDIKLISAGFVAESGEEFYFELMNHYDEGECSSFVCEAVLPHLNNEKYGLNEAEARFNLKVWIESFKEPVELCSDAPGYDWPLLYDIFSIDSGWPTNLIRKPVNVNSQKILQGIESYFEYQPIAIRHHALWDARALAAAAKAYENELKND